MIYTWGGTTTPDNLDDDEDDGSGKGGGDTGLNMDKLPRVED